MTLNVTGNNIHDTVGTSPDDGVFVEAENNDNYTVNVANNTLQNHGGDHVNITMINNATINVSITGNTLAEPEPGATRRRDLRLRRQLERDRHLQRV